MESIFTNQFEVDATIETIGQMRYTPAGILAVDLVLQHESELLEAGQKRQVKLYIKAVAFAEQAYQIQNTNILLRQRYMGFLASQGRKKQVVFHVTKVCPIE